MDCPCVDLDFVVLEYSQRKPAALVEYKHVNSRHAEEATASIEAMIDLANGYRDPLPFMIVTYNPEGWMFRVKPMNDAARSIYDDPMLLSEERYVKSLHYLRSKK